MRALVSAWILALILIASPIHAEEARIPSPYLIQLKTDGPLVLLSGAAWLGPKLLVHGIGRPPCPCDPSHINPLDRWVAGRDDQRLSRVSTLVEEALLTTAFVADGAEEGQSADEFAKDAVVFVETAEVDRGFGEFIKILAHRPRPLDYGKQAGDSVLADRKNYRSFYSGHTSVVAAVGTAYARTYTFRHPHSPDRWKVYGAVGLAALGEGALRVVAGRHFPTDVLAGAAAGSLVGLAVTELHRRDRPDSGGAVPGSGTIAFAIRIPLR